jgi:hypothetical protein
VSSLSSLALEFTYNIQYRCLRSHPGLTVSNWLVTSLLPSQPNYIFSFSQFGILHAMESKHLVKQILPN